MPARDVQSKEEDSVMGSADIMTAIISYLFIHYRSIPGKRPLPGKQGVYIAASI